MNDYVRNAAGGAIIGYGARTIYDNFNKKRMIERYNETGEIPEKKSMTLALLMSLFFGSIVLVFFAPRSAIPLIIIDVILLPLFFLHIITRPIVLTVAFISVLSHNNMALHLFGGFGEGRKMKSDNI